MKTITELTEVQKYCKRKFANYSNEDLVRRINNAPDFGWDDEGVEISRRRDAGLIKCHMYYNTMVIDN